MEGGVEAWARSSACMWTGFCSRFRKSHGSFCNMSGKSGGYLGKIKQPDGTVAPAINGMEKTANWHPRHTVANNSVLRT